MNQPTQRIYVVDGDRRICDSLVALLGPRGYCVQAFANADAFIAFPKSDMPSCLILDLHLGHAKGLELQQRLIGDSSMPVIFLTGYGDIPGTVRAMRAGAIDVLSKPVCREKLLPTIIRALKEAEEALSKRNCDRALRGDYNTLTPREREVLAYIVRGFLNKQTAYELRKSEITIRIHRGKIMRKMKAKSLPELVLMANRLGLIEYGDPTLTMETVRDTITGDILQNETLPIDEPLLHGESMDGQSLGHDFLSGV